MKPWIWGLVFFMFMGFTIGKSLSIQYGRTIGYYGEAVRGVITPSTDYSFFVAVCGSLIAGAGYSTLSYIIYRGYKIWENQQDLLETGSRYYTSNGRYRPIYDDKAFDELVTEALEKLPKEFVDRLKDNMSIRLADIPEGGNPYVYGVTIQPKNPKRWPTTIYLFRQNIEQRLSENPYDRNNVRRHILEVLFHEIGHAMGMDEETITNLMSEAVVE